MMGEEAMKTGLGEGGGGLVEEGGGLLRYTGTGAAADGGAGGGGAATCGGAGWPAAAAAAAAGLGLKSGRRRYDCGRPAGGRITAGRRHWSFMAPAKRGTGQTWHRSNTALVKCGAGRAAPVKHELVIHELVKPGWWRRAAPRAGCRAPAHPGDI